MWMHCIIFLHYTPSKVREFSNNSIEPGISAGGKKLQGGCRMVDFRCSYLGISVGHVSSA